MADNKKILYYLDELSDYKVASDYSDVRGWVVKDAEHRTIGKVDRLLVNKKSERVVYLDVEVDEALIEEGLQPYEIPDQEGAHGFLNKKGENHLILPIGLVALDEENKEVLSNEVGYNTFIKTKRFTKGANVDRDYEISVFRNYLPQETRDEVNWEDDDFYNRSEFGRH